MASPFGVKISKLILDYQDLIKNKNSALDIGCANGSNSKYLNLLGLNVVAIDKEVPKDFINNAIDIIEINVIDFNFKKYDIILALNILQFLDKKEQKKVLKKIINSLNQGGILFITSFTDKDPSYKVSKNIVGHFKNNELYDFAKNNNLEIIHYNEIMKKDNHEPYGEHKHGIVELVAKKI